MNPFEGLVAQSIENEMTRSQSFDLSNSGSSLFQQQTQITSVSNAIKYDPARLPDFLGYNTLNNRHTQNLETIYENVPISTQNFPSPNVRTNQTKEQQSLDKNNISIRGSISSWHL